MALAYDGYVLVSFFIQSVLYGVFIFLHVASISIMLRRREALSTSYRTGLVRVLTVALFMMLFATLHLGVNVRRVLEGFVYNHQGTAVDYFSRVNTVWFVVMWIVFYFESVLADAFAIYRVYVVWDGRKRVMVPLYLCFLAIIATGLLGIIELAQRTGESKFYTLDDFIPETIPFFMITIVANVSCTALLASRIWWTHRRARQYCKDVDYNKSPTILVAIIIAESVTIYLVWLVITLTLLLVKNKATEIFMHTLPLINGIVFSLIIVRVMLGLTTDEHHQQAPGQNKDHVRVGSHVSIANLSISRPEVLDIAPEGNNALYVP